MALNGKGGMHFVECAVDGRAEPVPLRQEQSTQVRRPERVDPVCVRRDFSIPIDKSDSILTGAPAPNAEDRVVRYGNGSTTTQRAMPFASGMSWTNTQKYIQYLPDNDPQRPNFITGTVDMQGYLEWLNKNGYNINLTLQGL